MGADSASMKPKPNLRVSINIICAWFSPSGDLHLGWTDPRGEGFPSVGGFMNLERGADAFGELLSTPGRKTNAVRFNAR